MLVFDDADVDRTLDTMATSKWRNAGQVCVSPTRFIVHQRLYPRFRAGFVERAKALRVGDGLDPQSQMGPMANARRPEAMERLVADATAHGARLDAGGTRIGNRGFFFAPTVLSEVPIEAQVMNEEPFGPIAIINPYADEDAMIAEANRLPYGLAAYLWTEDSRRQKRVARAIEAGMVGVNTSMIGGADAPFGGVKWSGHGSEDGPEGVQACLITKAIHEA